MYEHIEDYRLQNFYKKKLDESQYAYAVKQIRSQRYCGVKAIKATGYSPGVFVVKSEKTGEVRLWGVQHCKNPWACPICSARQMSKYATDLAVAIDAMKAQGKAAFMITFTIPHIRSYPCKTVFQALKNTHKRFVHHANSASQYSDIFVKFVRAINCEHRVKVCEFTFGENGWHPHYHALFFCDRNKLAEAEKWEEALRAKWYDYAKNALKKELVKIWDEERAEKSVEALWNAIDKSEGIYFSRDKRGKIRESKSSDYICGWGADKELTGNYRKQATAADHQTPYQLLQEAYDLSDVSPSDSDRVFKLFIEYALATRGQSRMKMSSKLRQIIDAYKKTHEYLEFRKKKATQIREASGKWHLVCWFKESQWLRISYLKLETAVLELARASPQPYNEIEHFLMLNGIDITANGEHVMQDFIVDTVINCVA